MMATALAQHSTVVVPCDFSVSWSISLRCGMPVPPVSSMALIVNDRLSRLAESVKFGARNDHPGNNRHDAGETKENAPEWKPYSFSSFSPSVLGRNQTKNIRYQGKPKNDFDKVKCHFDPIEWKKELFGWSHRSQSVQVDQWVSRAWLLPRQN